MKNTIMMLLSLTIGQTALANTYRCTTDSELTVEVNLKKRVAAFFDNDTWTKAKLSKTILAETLPPQLIFHFISKSKTYNGAVISFNKTKMEAHVSVNTKSSPESLIENTTCELIPASDLRF